MDKITAYVDSIVNHLDISQAEKAETRDEIIDHLRLSVENYRDKGYSEDEAVNKAIQSFGEHSYLQKEFHKSMRPYYQIYHSTIFASALLYTFIVLRLVVFVPFVERQHGINPITVFHHIPIVLGHQENFYIMLGYVIPNTVLFIPIGILLPLLFEQITKARQIVIPAIVFAVIIELVQQITRTGLFDFDTLFFATIGSLLGFALLISVRSAFEKYDQTTLASKYSKS
jgi:glycopeptide antibiotics resistance protein